MAGAICSRSLSARNCQEMLCFAPSVPSRFSLSPYHRYHLGGYRRFIYLFIHLFTYLFTYYSFLFLRSPFYYGYKPWPKKVLFQLGHWVPTTNKNNNLFLFIYLFIYLGCVSLAGLGSIAVPVSRAFSERDFDQGSCGHA